MDKNLKDVVTKLDEYIASTENRLDAILAALNWTIEDTLKERTCPSTEVKKESFCKKDPQLPESFGCTNSIVIEKPLLQKIINKQNISIPEKFSDIQLNFTSDQKCKIYDYVIANTAKTSEPELKVSLDDDDNAMTFAEIVAKAKKKDKKLRRKYRTSKPTHIEEVRNLVHLQMQALEKYFNPESEKVKSKSLGNSERNYNVSGHRQHKKSHRRHKSSDRRHQSDDEKPTSENKKHKSHRRDDDEYTERNKSKRKKHKSPKKKHHHEHHRRH